MTLPLQPHQAAPSEPATSISLQSRIGLKAANFFLAEVTGVVLPFLNDFLRSREWRYDSIRLATAIAVVANDLDSVAQGGRLFAEPVPVVFRQAVLKRDNGVLVQPCLVEGRHRIRGGLD
jgi:hypothetical protein